MRILVILIVMVLLTTSLWFIFSVSGSFEPTNKVDSSTPIERMESSEDVSLSETRVDESENRMQAEVKERPKKVLAEGYSLSALVRTVKEEADDSKVLVALRRIREIYPEEAEETYITLIGDETLPIRLLRLLTHQTPLIRQQHIHTLPLRRQPP